MDLINGYKTSKQNSALLKIFTEGFPGNVQISQGLEGLLNKNESTITRLLKRWQARKRPVHDEQSINLLCAQEKLERHREELRNQAVLYDGPVQLDSRNWVNKSRDRWFGFDPVAGEYFPDPIKLGVEVQWVSYQHLCVVESSSGALNLVQSFTNLVEAGERNGLDDDNWKSLFLMMSEKHLREAHSSISRFTDDLDGLIKEILNQINSEAELCKLRNALMKTTRSVTESVATVLGRIKSIYISIYRIRFPIMIQSQIDNKAETHALSCLYRLVSSESMTLFNQYNKVVQSEGDVMTIQLAASFITTNESTTPRHRITEQKYLPQQLANLDLFAFDASSQENFAVNSMKMGYQNRDTSRNKNTRYKTPERRPRSNERGRQFGRGSSPGNNAVRPRSNSRQRYDQRPRITSKDRIKGCLRCTGDHKAEDCTLEYSPDKCPTGCGYFHKERDCPWKKSASSRQSRKSNFGPTLAYRRYRTPGGRSSSYTRNEQGQRYREMISPGGSKYREYRQRSTSGERRTPKVAQPGTRQGASPGRKPGSAYKVQTVSVEDPSNSHQSDEYNSKNVFSGQNLYKSPNFTLN